MSRDEDRQRALVALQDAMTRARETGAITPTEWLALSLVPIGQGDAVAEHAKEALAASPTAADLREAQARHRAQRPSGPDYEPFVEAP